MTHQPASDRYDAMPYRRAGAHGLKLPALSLGLWHNFGDQKPTDSQRSIVRRAFDLGVTHFDLANNYGPPRASAETNFGRIVREDLAAHRDELVISTKAGYNMWPGPYGEWGSRKHLLASLDQSLTRLGLPYVDIFYSHRPDPDTPIEETMGALASAVQAGKALYVGVSNYSGDQTRAAAAALAALGLPLLVHQPRYSMFDRSVEQSVFPALAELGAGCVVFSPLAQGMLTDHYLDGSVPAGSRVATSDTISRTQISEMYLARARALNEIAAARGQSLAQLALSWVLHNPHVTSALLGVSSVVQLEQNLAVVSAPSLTEDELAAIERHAVDGTDQHVQ